MNVFYSDTTYESPHSSSVGVKCIRNPHNNCDCPRKLISDKENGNQNFEQLKFIGKVRIGDAPVTNDTPGFLPLRYEQPG